MKLKHAAVLAIATMRLCQETKSRTEKAAKRLWIVLTLLLAAGRLFAATNAVAVKLAIVPESPEAAAAADLLTAELTKNGQVQLLERSEIDRVYGEQGLSAANRDDLKLGRLLGADGLLLMEYVQEGTNTLLAGQPGENRQATLNIRLLAVKPGVVLFAQKFSWPVADLSSWASSWAGHLGSFLPKLSVRPEDAIPISVVDLRAAVSSAEAAEAERQLKLLAIQRLSAEPQLFVLERQQLDLAGTEKTLQADESAFWSGRYLVDGVVDPNGFSPEQITIEVRLTPPKGGQPVTFTVSGPRGNLAEVFDRLADRVKGALNLQAGAGEWEASSEAAAFFREGQWALRWEDCAQAQAAADSAWALGKHDLETAMLRIRVRLSAIPYEVSGYRIERRELNSSFFANGMHMPEPATFARIAVRGPGPLSRPDPQTIDLASSALELYRAFCHLSPDGTPQVRTGNGNASGAYESEWYKLGLDDLAVAAKVLQKFNSAPQAASLSEPLANLRQRAREVAALISTAPSVHDSYFWGTNPPPVGVDFLAMEPNIFRCEADWGCFWQERPEDTIAMYRELMSSGAFAHLGVVFRGWADYSGHLVAWTAADRARLPAVWKQFLEELPGPPKEPASEPTNGTARRPPALPPGMSVTVYSASPGSRATLLNMPARPLPHETPTNVLAVDRFLPIPLTDLPGRNIFGVAMTAHHWFENRLLIDFQYDESVTTYRNQTNWEKTEILTFPAVAMLDPAAGRWEVISCPPVAAGLQNYFYHRTTLWRGTLFNSDGGQIRRYDAPARQWRVLPISSGENFELFTVNDELYAANRNQTLQILENGKSTRLLGSLRLPSPGFSIDRGDLGTPTLFAGPGKTLRICTLNRFLTWKGSDWQEDEPAPLSLKPPEFSPAGILFRHSAKGFREDSVSRLLPGMKSPELCIGPRVRTNEPAMDAGAAAFFHVSRSAGSLAQPLWHLPRGYSIAGLAATLDRTNLYLLAGHTVVETVTNGNEVKATGNVLDQDGCNAILLCFTPGWPDPQKVYLEFERAKGSPPLAGASAGAGVGILEAPPAWLLFAGDSLLVGVETPVGTMASESGRGGGHPAGVWLLPVPPIASRLASQREAQLVERAEAANSGERRKKEFLAKYDRNHNGVIDPDEREEVMEDQGFMASQLDEIDTNHNGWLDLGELGWFDANQNNILEPKELAGLQAAERLLADRLVEQYDANDEDGLRQLAYDRMLHTCLGDLPGESELNFSVVDTNHDQFVEADELALAMQRRLETNLRGLQWRQRRMQMRMPFDPTAPRMGRAPDPAENFPAALEGYWQNAGGGAQRP